MSLRRETQSVRILYMEDDTGLARLLQRRLERMGHSVDLARDGAEGLALYDRGTYDLVAVDQNLPVHEGLEVVRRLAQRGPLPPTVMITGTGNERVAVEAMKLGVQDYIVKDLEGGYLELLPKVIAQVLERQRLLEDRRQAQEALWQRNHDLDQLSRLGQDLTAILNPEQVVARLLEAATDLAAAEAGVVWRQGCGDSHGLVGSGLLVRGGERRRFEIEPPSRSVAGWVAANGKSAVVADVPRDPRFFATLDGWEGQARRSVLAVPLRVRDAVVGVLEVVSTVPGGPGPNRLSLVETLAAWGAIAMENARLFAEVERLAVTDELTGAYNRRHFFEVAEREILRARRGRHPLSLIMLDLDRFKEINDTYGHAAGDEVLRAVAQQCRSSIREIDVLGRYGGEEFVVLLVDLPDGELDRVAERLRRGVEGLSVVTDRGTVSQLTVSLGGASLEADTPDLATLLASADAALYAAKQAGRNRAIIEPGPMCAP